jgi:hypothetical protein
MSMEVRLARLEARHQAGYAYRLERMSDAELEGEYQRVAALVPPAERARLERLEALSDDELEALHARLRQS